MKLFVVYNWFQVECSDPIQVAFGSLRVFKLQLRLIVSVAAVLSLLIPPVSPPRGRVRAR